MPNKETHRAFNQLLNTFLEINNKEEELAQDGTSGIKLVPIFLYNDTDKKLKVEFKIGNEQLTKINNLPDFFERMLNREKYKYNNVLEFIHEENAFEEQSRPLLKFLLKYAEIIKYANDVNNNYAHYGRNFNVNNVVLSNTGLDELFEILKGKTVEFETKIGERKIQFIDEPIDIKFILEKSDENTYCLTPNIDVYGYDIFYGKNYSYFLIDNKMHKCLPKVENRNLELLEVYKKNYTQSIIFNENNLRNFFAIVVPKIKDNFEIKNIDKEQIEKYMPKDLYVKIYLDYNEKGYIIADVKFCYGNVEFNPIKNVNLEITRNAIQENEVLDTFVQTGFMLDSANARLVLSKLEQYRRCPFSYFLQYGLKIKPQEELKVQSFDTGTFMHETIDEFFSIVKENGYQLSELTEEQISEIIDKIIDEKLLQNKNYIFTSTAKYRALVVRLKRLVKKALKYIVETLTEIEFDEKGKYKPIRITLDNGKNVEIIGKIDRIDTAQNEDGKYLRIIDYKSSIKNIDLNEVYAGLQIQLLTYLDAACKEEDLLPAGILYFNLIEQMVKTEKNIGIEKIEEQIRKGFKMKGLILADVKVVKLHDKNLDSGYSNLVPAYISKKTGDISEGNSSCVSKEEFKDLQDYMYKVIKQISNEILSGKIDLKPFYKNKKTPCSYCDYRSICNFNNGACQNKYNFIDEKSKKEILEKIKQEKSN